MSEITVTIEGSELVVRPLQEPTPSASGKTLVIASTHGNVTTTATVDGRPVVLGLNAYLRR